MPWPFASKYTPMSKSWALWWRNLTPVGTQATGIFWKSHYNHNALKRDKNDPQKKKKWKLQQPLPSVFRQCIKNEILKMKFLLYFISSDVHIYISMCISAYLLGETHDNIVKIYLTTVQHFFFICMEREQAIIEQKNKPWKRQLVEYRMAIILVPLWLG